MTTPWCKVPALLALLALASAPTPSAAADESLLICNAKNSSFKVTAAQLRELVIGHAKQWPSGKVFQLVLVDEGSAPLEWFAQTYLAVPARVLLGKIRQEFFKGELRKPISVADDEEAIAKVNANEGAFAVVKAGSALPRGVIAVKVVE